MKKPQKSVYERKGKGEGCFSIITADGNVFAMAADDGADDIKAQAPTIPVFGTALIQLMEALKDQRQFLWRDRIAAVSNGHINFAACRVNRQLQQAVFRAEFDRVIYQVVDHLGDIFLGCIGKHRKSDTDRRTGADTAYCQI